MTHAAVEETRQRNSPAWRAAWLALERYFWNSQRPWTVLWFVLPPIVLYEAGTVFFARDCQTQTETRILAFILMRDFLAMWGAVGQYLPCFVVIAVLLTWHIIVRDPWRVELKHTAGMWLESAMLAMPIFAMNGAVNYYVPLLSAEGRAVGAGVVLALGAGVYEEAVFRMIAFAVLSFALVDLLKINKAASAVIIVVLSALAFAAYHYWSPEATPVNLRDFTFRTVAGVYLGTIYLFRGLGISIGAHIIYDVVYFVSNPPSP